MKHLIKIRFIDKTGNEEEGIDGGGLLKEFVTIIVRNGFSPDYGHFILTKENTLIPNHNNLDDNLFFEFLGKIVGKAIYENILIEPVMSRVFLNLILGQKNTIEEL